MPRALGEPALAPALACLACLRTLPLPLPAPTRCFSRFRVGSSLGEFVDHIGQINALRTIISSRIRRSLHSQFRLLASGLNLACARGVTGQRPIDQCWRRQARACRRLCVLSAWCLRASEGRGTGSLAYICGEAFLGIASPPGSWKLHGLPEMRRNLGGPLAQADI